MLDEEYKDEDYDGDENDDNVYCTGSIAKHKVVIGQFGGVVQYDMGKSAPNEFRRTGFLNSPPQLLLSAVTAVHANNLLGKGTLRSRLTEVECIPAFQRQKAGPDILFDASYDHEGGATCTDCNNDMQVIRSQRDDGAQVVIHSGTIASGNQVMRSATQRDQISHELGGVLCFEMEAAGLMNTFPCIVIRGICDYSDSHKNKEWQPYAAGTAAAYAKELLSRIPATDVKKTRRAEEAMPKSPHPRRSSTKRQKIETDNNGQEHELSRKKKKAILDSLKFARLGARKRIIKRAHRKTCKWLLGDARYAQWLRATDQSEHHGLLWIKGKPGAGKSTLMKFAVDTAHETMKQAVILSFFFNARGDDVEKSTPGLYRALLVQLLERIPRLQNLLGSLFTTGSNSNVDREWDIESLQTLLEKAIQDLDFSIVVCFIDALDECDQAQVREMVEFFDHICEMSVQKGIHFSVCFSSRPYPHITARKGVELVLDDQDGHTEDLTNYIEAELKIGQSEMAKRIRTDLQNKSAGIFMWVVLVVGILNKESDRGRIHSLEEKLKEIPNDLDNLFHDILTRDSSNTNDLILCIQWVLFTNHPLSPSQLYYAVLSCDKPEASTLGDTAHITKDVIERFVLDCSKGLIEITRPEATKKFISFQDESFLGNSEQRTHEEEKVQFIHESVRDFLLNENGLGRIWPQYKANFEGQSHERLKQCCLNQICKARGMKTDTADVPKPISWQLKKETSLSTAQNPTFLRYAVKNVLKHANVSEEWGTSQTGFISSFPLRSWVELDNMLTNDETHTHSMDVSLLYRLAELNCADLILVHFQPKQCLKTEDERYGCPIFAACALSNSAAIRAFSLILTTGRARKKHRHELNEGYTPDDETSLASNRATNFVYSKEKGFLENAAAVCPEHLMLPLIRSWRDAVDSPDTDPWYTIAVACDRGHAAVVELLTDERALSSRGHGVESRLTPLLHYAIENGEDSILRILLGERLRTVFRREQLDQALQLAAHYGRTLPAAILLDAGADVNAQSDRFVNALYAATCNARQETAFLLILTGANVNAQGGKYGNALQAAVHRDYLGMTSLLIQRGANVNAQGGHYGNALHAASLYGKMEIAEMLLDSGADPNAPGGILKNSLQAVSMFHGNSDLKRLLIEKGALNP
ncbi:hypothetical protein J4E91_003198 [Alternaria rosae]|nr:hypothetical protein J4E91_003198 [Alternaria rosae]